MRRTGERVIPAEYRQDPKKFLIFLVHVKSYAHAMTMVRGKRVLDFGCGTGYGANMLAGQVEDVTGVDISEEAILDAAKDYPASNLHFLRIEPTENAALPFPDSSFDDVVSFQVIEHVRDVDSYLREIRRVLKPSGRLMVTTPNAALRLLPGQRPWNRFHIREYTYKAVKHTLQKEFSFVEVEGITAMNPWLEMENARVNRIKWLTLPFTNLLVPDLIRRQVLEVVWSRFAEREGSASRHGHDRPFPKDEDVFVTSSAVDRCLKFFAVCSGEPLRAT